METLTFTQVGHIVERHFTRNKRAVKYNRKYLNSSPRAKQGNNLRNRIRYYRKKLKQAKDKNNTPYIHKCESMLKELIKNLKSLGFKIRSDTLEG